MHSYIIYRKELFLKGIVFIVVVASLGAMSTLLLKSRIVSLIVLVVLVSPIFLIRLLISKFKREIDIEFGLGRFVSIVKLPNGEGESKIEVDLNSVDTYSVQFPNEKFNSIKFNLRDGSNIEYSFFRSEQRESDSDAEAIVDSFHALVENYNNTFGETRVRFKPSFYATKIGLICIALLSLSLIAIILITSYFKANALPFSLFFGFILILQLILKRNKELGYYKKIVESRRSSQSLPETR
jgi:hypothetical protein